MKTRININLRNDNDEILCSLEAVTYYDDNNEFDEGETFYIHPMTGEQCQTIDQCFQGWSEQDEESNNNWNTLRELIKEDNDKEQYFADEVDIDYYISA
jgi:hypothetical protein